MGSHQPPAPQHPVATVSSEPGYGSIHTLRPKALLLRVGMNVTFCARRYTHLGSTGLGWQRHDINSEAEALLQQLGTAEHLYVAYPARSCTVARRFRLAWFHPGKEGWERGPAAW